MNVRTQPVNALSVDELIVAVAYLGILSDRVHENGHDIPTGLKSELRDCERELDERLRADKERKLKVLRMQREGLLTASERRKKVEGEIEALEAELGVGTKSKARGR